MIYLPPHFNEITTAETVVMVYKSINSLDPNYLSNLFTKNTSRDIITLRSSDTDLYVPFMNTKNDQKAFSYHGALIWNDFEACA